MMWMCRSSKIGYRSWRRLMPKILATWLWGRKEKVQVVILLNRSNLSITRESWKWGWHSCPRSFHISQETRNHRAPRSWIMDPSFKTCGVTPSSYLKIPILKLKTLWGLKIRTSEWKAHIRLEIKSTRKFWVQCHNESKPHELPSNHMCRTG